MKKFKKMIALVIAMVMVLAMSTVAFADPDPMSSEFANGSYTATPEDEITATNLTAGDSVQYFQVLKWDPDNGGWVYVSEAIATAVNLDVDDIVDGINEEEATAIASAFDGKTGTNMDVDGTTATASNLEAGLYYLRAIPAEDNKSTVYNPAFVSADYYEGGNEVDLSTTIGGSVVLKKTDVPFDKEVDDEDLYNDVKVGDKVPFKITTTIPSYGTSFDSPVFTITDTLSDGLTLDGDITVVYGDSQTKVTNADVTITKGTPTNGFTVAFTEDYLTGLEGATPDVEITYKAEVTTEALNNVTFLDNKAKLEFSNAPDETQDKDDKTRHYTFSIDGLLNGGGQTSERTHEMLKVGVDANGDPIVSESERVTYHGTAYGPLAGATFELKGKAGTPTEGIDLVYTTTGDGHLVFNGLDAGEYTLEETEAPAGFVRNTEVYTVTITATYDDATKDDAILTGYTITIKDSKNKTYASGGASFTMDNKGTVSEAADVISSSESATNPFNNTQGLELPSTGGMGTTIFYLVGAALVICAGVLLVTKRRMKAEN